jgi:hypothetical protein
MKLDKYLKKIQRNEAVGSFAIENPYSSGKTWSDKYLKRKKKMVEEELRNFGSDPKRVLVDFDRTIHAYSHGIGDGTIYDKPINEAKESLQQLIDEGYEVCIFTARVCRENRKSDQEWKEQIRMVKDWLEQNEIPYHRVTGKKLAATAIIDDRAVHFTGDWKKALQDLKDIESSNI